MRLTILAGGLAGVTVLLLRLLLDPATGEVNAAFLSAAAVIAFNLTWIEGYQTRDASDVDRLLPPVRAAYTIGVFSLVTIIAHLMLQIQPEAPAWLRVIAVPVVISAVIAPLSIIPHLLCRISFSAAEMRASDRRRRERAQQRTVIQ
jgi:hypothetical protein